MAVPAEVIRVGRAKPRLRPVPATREHVRSRTVSGRVPFVLFSLIVVAAMVVLLTIAETLVTQGSIRVAELERQAERLEDGYGRLRLRIAELSSPDRIVRAAERAGLVLPADVEILPIQGSP